MKKKSNSSKVIAGLIIALVSIVALLIVVNALDGSDDDDVQTDTNNTAEDESDNGDNGENNDIARLFYVGNTEMYEIINDRTGEGFFVYVGRPACPHCAAFEPVLEETLEYLDQDLRYYQTDLAALGDDESEMTMAEIIGELDVTGVPRILYIENGAVIDALSGNQPKENVLTFFDDNGGLN